MNYGSLNQAAKLYQNSVNENVKQLYIKGSVHQKNQFWQQHVGFFSHFFNSVSVRHLGASTLFCMCQHFLMHSLNKIQIEIQQVEWDHPISASAGVQTQKPRYKALYAQILSTLGVWYMTWFSFLATAPGNFCQLISTAKMTGGTCPVLQQYLQPLLCTLRWFRAFIEKYELRTLVSTIFSDAHTFQRSDL